MTVQELIDQLNKFKPDATVVKTQPFCWSPIDQAFEVTDYETTKQMVYID